MADNNDENFLARWLNNELSEKELEEFQKSTEYEEYLKIVGATDQLQAAEFETGEILSRIKRSANRRMLPQRKNTRSLAILSGVAAAVLLFIVAYSFLSTGIVLTTDYGEQRIVKLPDGSEMILNARSEASYNEDDWAESRLVKLTGEAFFDVEKGSTFTVKTSLGEITVLGTEFNVSTGEDLLLVACYEGKVRVDYKDGAEELKAGQLLQLSGGDRQLYTSNATNPSWLENVSTFESVPLEFVFTKLENEYNITFKNKELIPAERYTGSFPNDDRDTALKIVLQSIPLNYEISGKTVILKK